MSNTFDPNKDYMEEMRKKASAGDEAGFNAAQTARNAKIDAGGLGYAKANYSMSDFAKQNGISAVPQIGPQVNPTGKPYSVNSNYMQESINAAKNGNLAGAMYNERMHNIKDGDLGLGWGASGVWNYQDNQGLGGLREAKYNEIQDYFDNGFQYDYRDDEQYQAMRRLKEQEAEKAYNDGYAALSRQFEGDIPVNMINKLLATKSEIKDQADSYIPTLKQMAYDMYMNKGNQLYNQYGLLDALENQQYQRFYGDRDFMAQGVNDAWTRQYQLGRDAIADERYGEEQEYVKGIDKQNWQYDMAAMIYNDADGAISWEEAFRRAAKYL